MAAGSPKLARDSGASPPGAITVAGVRLPGSGRVRFCDAGTVAVDLFDWVALAGSAGDEPGQVVIAPRQIEPADPPQPLPYLTRRLASEEVERVVARADEARASFDTVIELVRRDGLPLFVTGLRYTLDGRGALLPFRGPQGFDTAALAASLSERLGVTAMLEWEGELEQVGGGLFGGLGRLRTTERDLSEIVRERFDRPGADVFAPGGYPRLGARVATPEGTGTIQSISTRHREARVRLDDAGEIRVPIDALRPAP